MSVHFAKRDDCKAHKYKMLQIVDASSALWLASTLAILTVGFGIVYLCSPQRRARQSSYSERNQWHDSKISLIATHSKLSPLYNFQGSVSKLTHLSFPGAQKTEQKTLQKSPSMCQLP